MQAGEAVIERMVVERFVGGQMTVVETIELSHRLLNEDDLDAIVHEESGTSFVRSISDTAHGYYRDAAGRWAYGSYREALNEIKRRI